MKDFVVKNQILCKTDSTEHGVEFLKRLPLRDVFKVTIEKERAMAGPAKVTFYFTNGDVVMIIGAFSTGYDGSCVWGLHDVLIECGYREEDANKVFSPCTRLVF